MNELSLLFSEVNSGEIINLEKKVYDVRPEDSFIKKGFFCSNSAKQNENPEGIRYSAVFLENKRDITIDGNGAEILVHGKMTPMLFNECENITVRNLTINYKCPTMTEFTVTDFDGEYYTLRINDDCIFSVEGNELFFEGEKDISGRPYWRNECSAEKRYIKVLDPITEETSDFDRRSLKFSDIRKISENTVKFRLSDENIVIPVNSVFQTRNIIRDQVGSMFQRSSNLTFENLRVKFMHGLGMVSQYCENVTFRNCDFTPDKNRTIASTADFFQFSGCKGKIEIDSCKAYGAQDDYVNVHGTHLRIIEKNDSEKSLLLRFMHPETWGFQAFAKDDKIEFIKWDTLIPYGNTTVTKAEKINNTDIKIYVDNMPLNVTVGKDVVENTTWTPDLYIHDCDFGRTSGRGILCTTKGKVLIENNRFYKLCGPALLVEDDCNFWFESGYTDEIIFRNNEVISCNFGKNFEYAPVIQYSPKVMNEDSTEFVHKRLVAVNNKFRCPVSEKHSFHLSYLREADISDNDFDAPFEIYEKCVGNIFSSGNKYKENI